MERNPLNPADPHRDAQWRQWAAANGIERCWAPREDRLYPARSEALRALDFVSVRAASLIATQGTALAGFVMLPGQMPGKPAVALLTEHEIETVRLESGLGHHWTVTSLADCGIVLQAITRPSCSMPKLLIYRPAVTPPPLRRFDPATLRGSSPWR